MAGADDHQRYDGRAAALGRQPRSGDREVSAARRPRGAFSAACRHRDPPTNTHDIKDVLLYLLHLKKILDERPNIMIQIICLASHIHVK